MLGILPRTDLSSFHHKKRLEVNSILRRLCNKEEIEFLDLEFNAHRLQYLARDGLHLNWLGADMVARRIFNASECTCKCKPLN